MTKRYKLPLFAQTVNVGSGRLDASPDGWFYPRTPAEEAALVAAGCTMDDTASGTTPRPITTESPEFQSLVRQDPTTGALVGAGGEVIPVLGRQLILNGASAGTDSGWQRIAPSPERLVYQLTSGSVSTGYAVDISADGVTSLGQAFTGTWARSDLAYITGLISFSNPLAKYFRVTVTSGGPISMARGA